MRIAITILSLALTAAAAGKLQLKDLPPAVQKTVQENLKGGEIKTITKEVEKGVTQYEIESVLNGKRRDFNVDLKGGLVVMEEEASIESIPEAARTAIQKKAGAGKLGMIEIVTRGSEKIYEAAYTTKAGKKASVMVKADGSETK